MTRFWQTHIFATRFLCKRIFLGSTGKFPASVTYLSPSPSDPPSSPKDRILPPPPHAGPRSPAQPCRLDRSHLAPFNYGLVRLSDNQASIPVPLSIPILDLVAGRGINPPPNRGAPAQSYNTFFGPRGCASFRTCVVIWLHTPPQAFQSNSFSYQVYDFVLA